MTTKKSNIHIKPSKVGTFTAAAKKRGKGVQSFASQVLANKENYSPAMVKKANFARNAAKWKHPYGGILPKYPYGASSTTPLSTYQLRDNYGAYNNLGSYNAYNNANVYGSLLQRFPFLIGIRC